MHIYECRQILRNVGQKNNTANQCSCAMSVKGIMLQINVAPYIWQNCQVISGL